MFDRNSVLVGQLRAATVLNNHAATLSTPCCEFVAGAGNVTNWIDKKPSRPVQTDLHSNRNSKPKFKTKVQNRRAKSKFKPIFGPKCTEQSGARRLRRSACCQLE